VFRDLFLILFRPSQTLDRLLEEGDMGKSWKATWTLVAVTCLSVLLMVPVMLLFSQTQYPAEGPFRDLPVMAAGGLILISLALLMAAFMIVYLVLARYVFAWMVRAGLRLVAGDRYPASEAERQEKGRLVELIQPYTLAILMWPQLLTYLLYLLAAVALSVSEGDNGQLAPMIFSMVMMLVAVLLYVASIGAQIYMIVVRVMAIKKIYKVSTSKAFFGPMLMYLIPGAVLFVLMMIVFVLISFASLNGTV
jgi:hypothetical protein